MAHSSLDLLGSIDPPTSASQVAETTNTCCHAQLIFKNFLERQNLCCQGWSQTHSLKVSPCLSLPECWDYRHEPLHPASFVYLFSLPLEGGHSTFVSSLESTMLQAFCLVMNSYESYQKYRVWKCNQVSHVLGLLRPRNGGEALAAW